jgi:hypothetical protein
VKYSHEERQGMARHVVAARAAGDQRALLLVAALAARTNTHPNECIRRIKLMAQGAFEAAERSESWDTA